MSNTGTVREALHDLPQIPTERLLLRRLRLDDAEDLFAYASDPKVTATLVWETHLSIDDSVAFLQQVIASYAEDAGAVWGIEDNESGRIIGTISFNTIRGEGYIGDVGYALARPYWGRGLMTEALAAVLDYGFRHMGLHRIEATCRDTNVGSYRVMEKCGMLHEGTLRDGRYVKGRLETFRIYASLRREFGRTNRRQG
ncbi:MAG: GNAT family N-acetyltransferase [Thermomicrobiales bacterium]